MNIIKKSEIIGLSRLIYNLLLSVHSLSPVKKLFFHLPEEKVLTLLAKHIGFKSKLAMMQYFKDNDVYEYELKKTSGFFIPCRNSISKSNGNDFLDLSENELFLAISYTDKLINELFQYNESEIKAFIQLLDDETDNTLECFNRFEPLDFTKINIAETLIIRLISLAVLNHSGNFTPSYASLYFQPDIESLLLKTLENYTFSVHSPVWIVPARAPHDFNYYIKEDFKRLFCEISIRKRLISEMQSSTDSEQRHILKFVFDQYVIKNADLSDPFPLNEIDLAFFVIKNICERYKQALILVALNKPIGSGFTSFESMSCDFTGLFSHHLFSTYFANMKDKGFLVNPVTEEKLYLDNIDILYFHWGLYKAISEYMKSKKNGTDEMSYKYIDYCFRSFEKNSHFTYQRWFKNSMVNKISRFLVTWLSLIDK